MKPLEERFAEHILQPGGFVTSDQIVFVAAMRLAASRGVGYGWMQQVIEWEWQVKAGAAAWGPEYFNKKIREIERRR